MTDRLSARVALVGSGAVARLYYGPALARLDATGAARLVGVYDPDAAAAAALSSFAPQATIAPSIGALIARGVDLLIVASPPHVHAEQTIAALEEGVAVLCEKPLAPSRVQAEAMISASARTGIPLLAGMVRRHLPAARAIQAMIRSGAIGCIKRVDAFEGGPFTWPVRSPAYFDKARGGVGVLQDIGSHALDLLRWWLGEPDSVDYADDAMGGLEANCRIALGFGPARVMLQLSRDWHRPNRYRLEGERGWITWDTNDAAAYTFAIDGAAPASVSLQASFATFEEAFDDQIVEAIRAARGEGNHAVPAQEVLGTVALVERCAAERRPLRLSWISPAGGQRGPAKKRVGVIGASGFIGNRTVELLHLSGRFEVVPVVRRPAGLCLPKRFGIPAAVADVHDEAALEQALVGCEVAVIAVAGDPATIVGLTGPVYRAAERAGIRRLVYLSTASVHGQAPAPGTDERSALSLHQAFAYNTAKIRAEQAFLALRQSGSVELVMLRPGIVHGPRSQWIGSFADALLDHSAFVFDHGKGICNAVHVDNVVHAIERAIVSPAGDGEAFLIGDDECVTWRDLFSPITRALGQDFEEIPQRETSEVLDGGPPLWRRAAWQLVRFGIRQLPYRTAQMIRAARSAGREKEAAVAPINEDEAIAFREMALLQSCTWRLPSAKAAAMLGYNPPLSFADGSKHSIDWLAFAGYPVVSR